MTAAECDLADLSSVRGFASAWLASGAPLDVLVCNGGLQYSGDNAVRRTKDGFEITVGTNHLGHFLLTNLLLDAVELSAGPGKIVVTASEVHNPESPGGSVGPAAGLGDLRGLATNGAAFEMIDGSEYNADKAYKDSKLCNVLFTLELQRRLAARGSAVTVNCYGPGLITRTGAVCWPSVLLRRFRFGNVCVRRMCILYRLCVSTLCPRRPFDHHAFSSSQGGCGVG